MPLEAAVDAQQIADAKWFEQLVMANVYRPARDAVVGRSWCRRSTWTGLAGCWCWRTAVRLRCWRG